VPLAHAVAQGRLIYRFVADKFGGRIALGMLSPPYAVWIAQNALSPCEISQR
jgi:hypothetical protein